jgi:glyoxylase-like metal-dependent hydrolase (beta-lactamase superfamily II)
VDDDGLIVHNYGCFIVHSLGTTILVDTGLGERADMPGLMQPPALPDAMADAGFAPGDVDLVLFTHLHFDHSGWNTRDAGGDFALTFPNARYVCQQAEYDYWTGPGDKPSNGPDFERVLAPLIAADRLELVGGEYAATREVVAVPTPGHTPGHVSFVVGSGTERAYILGDVVNKPVQLTEPDWYPIFDLDPAQATASRRQLLDRAEAEGALLAGGHFPLPSMGHAVRVDGRRTFRYLP